MSRIKSRIVTGIDVGTYKVRVVVMRVSSVNGNDKSNIKLLGTGIADSRGMRNGYIIDQNKVASSIKNAVYIAEKNAGVKIKNVFASIGSIGLDEIVSTGEIIPTRADSEITEHDVNKVCSDSEDRVVDKIPNRYILHNIPLRYRVDGEQVLGSPETMQGTKLEVDMLFVTTFEKHLTELNSALESAGLTIENVAAGQFAASTFLLNSAQKRAGCILVNIGAETVSTLVYEDDLPISAKIFPIGSSDITNDLALGLQISIEEAEKIKTGGASSVSLPKKKVVEIIEARLIDIFELINNDLKKIKKDGLLPAGVILTGGGATFLTKDVACKTLSLPAKLAPVEVNKNIKMKDPSWSVAFGLCLLGVNPESDNNNLGLNKHKQKSVYDWITQFLP